MAKKKVITDESESVFEFLRGGKHSTAIIPKKNSLVYIEATDGELYLFPLEVLPEDIVTSIEGLELEE